MFENLTKSVSHIVCLIWKFSRGGWRTAYFLPGNTKWCTKCYHLCSSIINAQFKAFWIPILQYNNSLKAPWKRCAIIEPKSKRGSKESWIKPNGHNHDLSRIWLIVTPLIEIWVLSIERLTTEPDITGFDSRGLTDTEGLKRTEKWGQMGDEIFTWLRWRAKNALSPIQ